MSRKDKIWIKLMEVCCKYWGCHQMPERSFFINNYQLPVCARCTGMMVGYIMALFLALFGKKIKFYICLLMMIPMIIDGCVQYKTAYLSNNFKRVVTGFLYGIGFIQIIIKLIGLIVNLLRGGI